MNAIQKSHIKSVDTMTKRKSTKNCPGAKPYELADILTAIAARPPPQTVHLNQKTTTR